MKLYSVLVIRVVFNYWAWPIFRGRGVHLSGYLMLLGLVSPDKFRESCAPTVLLVRLQKRTFLSGEQFNAKMEIYHFGEDAIKKEKLNWSLVNEDGCIIRKGVLNSTNIQPYTVDSLGMIRFDLEGIDSARQLALKAEVAGIKNEWDIWVYPRQIEKTNNFFYARAWNKETQKMLEEGKNVLLMPEKYEGRKTHFASHFWNPIMFNWNPMIVGTLIEARHPAFNDFPTKEYADWQWWDILNYTTALEMNNLKNITPVIQSIDSYETNQKLGIAFEAKVGNGKLFVLCVDPEKNIDQRIATQQLITSVKNYVVSKLFDPKETLQFYEIEALFPVFSVPKEQRKSQTAIQQLLNK